MATWTFGENKKNIEEALKETYKWFPRLKEKGNARAGSLSRGEQRMLKLARILCGKPKFLLIDEFSGARASDNKPIF